MKVLIIGSAKENKTMYFKKETEILGRILAEKNYTMMSGGGAGIFKLAFKSYRSNNGKNYVVYLTSKNEMERCKGEIGPKPDKIVQTNLDYPERNLQMIKDCDCVIAFGGGLFTLTEIIHSAKDYDKKVCVIEKDNIAIWIKLIEKIRKKVFLTKDVEKAINYFEK